MILPFSTKINGKPTYFVEKIHKSLREIYYGRPALTAFAHETFELTFYHMCRPKIHTIREDKKDRWKDGTMIDFFINNRTKNMFRFAPRVPVVTTQTIEIIHNEYINDIIINIDDRKLTIEQAVELAHNDGFENLYEFICYFNSDFTGKIIHWTNKRY